MPTDQTALAAFADRLNVALKGRGLSQAGLGATISAHPNAVSGWVRGQRWPRVENLLAIAATLDVRLDWLVAGVEQHDQPTQLDETPAMGVTRELAELAPALVQLAERARDATATSRSPMA